MTGIYKKEERAVSVKQFVYELMKHLTAYTENTDCIDYGYHRGWLEDQDVTGKDHSLVRKNAARIIHEFMRHELQESDEPTGNAGEKLQDLYDCRVCVRHVIQVYVKGIMNGYTTPEGRFILGMNEFISKQEMDEIMVRLFNPSLRVPQVTISATAPSNAPITIDEALHYYRTQKNALIIDVRTCAEFTATHLEPALNHPLISILKNPYAVSTDRDQMLLLYCADGYQSEIAAQCLRNAGYEKVFYFAWKADNINP